MAKTYEEREQEQLAKAKTQGDAYATERRVLADRSAATVDATYTTAIEQAEKQYTRSAKDTEASYRGMYDANAVNELVARRNAEEAIANSNMANSGLNNTQQTAISLSRSRADSQTTQQKQQAVDAIMRELDAVSTQYQREAAAQKQELYAAADQEILNYKNALDASARENAAALYTADQEAATAAAQLQADYQLKMLGQGYQYDSSTGQYVYVGTEAERLAAMEQEIAAANAPLEAKQKERELISKYVNEGGYSYDEAVKMATGVSVTEANTKAKAMSAAGTPSYTAINAQAMAYTRNISSEKAREYIEQQYAMGYITEVQREELLATQAQSGIVWARGQIDSKYDFDRRGGAMTYGSYENYVKTRLMELIGSGKITEQDFAMLAGEFGVGG